MQVDAEASNVPLYSTSCCRHHPHLRLTMPPAPFKCTRRSPAVVVSSLAAFASLAITAVQPKADSSSAAATSQWEAFVFDGCARVSGGVFLSAEAAARAHDRLLLKLHGPRAAAPLLNFPKELWAEWPLVKKHADAEDAETDLRELACTALLPWESASAPSAL